MNWNPSWANAIASIESQGSGGYNAVGPVTQKGNQAYGKYQVMDFNIPSWTKKHLGQELTPDQFLQNPEAQEAVFKGEFGSSVAKYGNPQDAASVWFTGRPASEGPNRSDILGTTGSKYVDKFNNALGTGATPTGGQQMMQPKQKPRGLLSGLLGDEDKRARLAMALEGMTLNPNRGLMAAMQGGIEQRRDDKLAATEADKTEAQRNSTGKWLMENGFKEIGAGVLSGAISGSAGLQMSQKAGNTKDTALIRNALAAGYKPGTPEYQRFIASGGDIFSQEAAIRANLPKPESGMAYEFEKDERGNIVGYKLVPIEGGKADRNAQKTKEGEDTVLTTAGLVLDNINSIQDMLKNSKLPIAGLTGNMLQKVPGTSAYDVSALAATIKANIGFDRLQRMRMESPTGGALGNVSNQELTSLQATLGNLDQAQSQQQFADQLQDIEAQYLAILNKFNEYPEDVRAKVGYTKTKISEAPTGSTQEIEAEDGVYTIKQKP